MFRMSQGSAIKLRRPKTVIEKNLQPLKANNKKELAQRLYYNNNRVHKSPLVIQRKRRPVHQRLGLKQQPLGTNTNFIYRKRRKEQFNKHTFMLTGKRPQTYSQKGKQGMTQFQQASKTGIKLKRLTTPKNLTIHLRNPHFTSTENNTKRFKMELNRTIQAEILEIQREDSNSNEICFLPTLKIKPNATKISCSERFGRL